MSNRYSLIAVISCSLLLCCAMFFYCPRWQKESTEYTFAWDAGAYYSYLPSLFIYKDIKTLQKTDSVYNAYGLFPGMNLEERAKKEYNVIVYSSGLALVQMPGFFVAHTFAKVMGYPADGFSKPYAFFAQLTGLLISIAGLWYLRKLLLRYYTDTVTALTIFLLCAGTIYFNYASADSMLTHNLLFTVYVLLLLNTAKFYEHPSYKYAVRIGLLIGLAILIRPTEMISCIIPLLWGLRGLSIADIKVHFSFLGKHTKLLALAGVCAILPGLLQVAYWKYVSGQMFFYSYQGIGFSWDGRYIYKYLFSYGSGWVMYNPMMIFALIGFIIYFFKGQHRIAVILFLLVNFYIVSAWDVWWYSGLGGRAMIQSYALFSLPLALFVKTILHTRVWKWVVAPFVLLFFYFNVWLFIQAHAAQSLYDPVSMSEAYYWAVVGRWKGSHDTEKLKDTDEVFKGKPKNMKLILKEDFERDTAKYCNVLPPIQGMKSACTSPDRMNVYMPTFSLTTNAKWLRLNADVIGTGIDWDIWAMPKVFIVFEAKEGVQVKERSLRLSRYMHYGAPISFYFDIKIPEKYFDEVRIFFCNNSSPHTMLIDNVSVYTFDE